MKEEFFMERVIQLAKNGFGSTSPNPMVGALIESKGRILAEGWHYKSGKNHAEVQAISLLKDSELLDSTLYVNLEPCSHFGKTPPCVDLVIEKKISKVVVGITDPNKKVDGDGIKKLKKAGIKVITGVLEKKCYDLNKRFFTFHKKERPFIILKWAQSADNFIDRKREKNQEKKPFWISNFQSRALAHLWRGEEDAILVGRNTVLIDNPRLNIRNIKGKNPTRILIDPYLRVDLSYHIYDESQKTFVFCFINPKNKNQIKLDPKPSFLKNLLKELYKKNIQSLLVEGGKNTLEQFIKENLWDEARIFSSFDFIKDGLKAPILKGKIIQKKEIKTDQLFIIEPL